MGPSTQSGAMLACGDQGFVTWKKQPPPWFRKGSGQQAKGCFLLGVTWAVGTALDSICIWKVGQGLGLGRVL